MSITPTSAKIRVAVLFGGQSGEHEISLLSAHSIIQHLDRAQFTVIPIGIDRQGSWRLGTDKRNHDAPLCLPDAHSTIFHPNLLKAATNTSCAAPFDVIFPAVHGTLCEDGTLQGLLEQADIPYVGCGVLASAISMDKDISKRLARDAGIDIAPFVTLQYAQWQKNPAALLATINTQLPHLPLFVKPANTGSSVGIRKVKNIAQLTDAIDEAFAYDNKVIVEQGIDARELETAVLESLTPGEPPIVSLTGEIQPQHEFYDYTAKYLDDHGAEFHIPAQLDAATAARIKQLAADIFTLLNCSGMARVDLFLDRQTDKLYFNEINTIPGFTAISLYPRLMQASGMSYPALLTHLIKLALQRHTAKQRLRRAFPLENTTCASA